MVGYMSLEEQVDADFTRARRRAFLRRLMAGLRNGTVTDGLPCFEDFRKKLGVVGGIPPSATWPVPLTPLISSVRTKWNCFMGAIPALLCFSLRRKRP